MVVSEEIEALEAQAIPPIRFLVLPRVHPRESKEGAVLLSFWSPKGGSGTSVVAAACALVLTRSTATLRAPGAT